MRPVPVTPPAELPVTVQEAKDHTIIHFADDDLVVERFIKSATEHLDGYRGILGRCIVNQEWRQDYVGWGSCLRLPFPNVSAAAVEYIDEDGNPQTVAASDYQVIEDARGARVQFSRDFSAPALAQAWVPVSVTFTAGYGAASAVPWDVKVAICMLAAHWYDERRAASDKAMKPVPYAVDALLAKHRWVTI